jgi:signal transduction histidine kinase
MHFTSYNKPKMIIEFALLLSILFLWPLATRNVAFDVIVDIRTAITTGNSSLLMRGAIQNCMLFMIPSFLLYMLMESIGLNFATYFIQNRTDQILFVATTYSVLLLIINNLSYYPIEVMTAALGMGMTLGLVYFSSCENDALLPKVFISLQVFFLIQWINMVPELAKFHIGMNDLSTSLKIASLHLGSHLNQLALIYMSPLMISSFLTALLIRLYIQNLKVAEEKHQKEMAFEEMQQHVMNNRIYQEINALAHDLKTPLATIQGLVSLLVLSKDVSKIESYGSRIESSISKMSDMISSFLYGDAREVVSVEHLVQYIRAQVPLEQEKTTLLVDVEPDLPSLEINKVRMARALVNILENAILAPVYSEGKTITVKAQLDTTGVLIRISDNGMGVKEEDLCRIWDIGFSGKNTSGLGLPFAKQTVLENNGKIELESTYGKGTTVFIWLPASDKGVQS